MRAFRVVRQQIRDVLLGVEPAVFAATNKDVWYCVGDIYDSVGQTSASPINRLIRLGVEEHTNGKSNRKTDR